MKRTAADVIKGLIKLGVMASISEVIDYDTAAIVAEEDVYKRQYPGCAVG